MLTSVIRAIIFDLDGTLVHSLSGIAKALNTILEHHQLPTHSESTVRTFIGDGIVKLVERACPDGYDPGQMAELTGAVSNEYAAAWKDGTVPYTGVNETLTALLQREPRLPFCQTSRTPSASKSPISFSQTSPSPQLSASIKACLPSQTPQAHLI